MLYKIPLKNADKYAILDGQVYETIRKDEYLEKIHFLKNLRLHSNGYAFYQKNYPRTDGTYKNVTIYLHKYIAERFVEKTPSKKKLFITFLNGNRLDCRKENLKYATRSEICRNQKLPTPMSGYRGVTKRPSGNYSAHIFIGSRPLWLGTFKTAVAAAEAYNKMSIKLFGETNSLNVIKKE